MILPPADDLAFKFIMGHIQARRSLKIVAHIGEIPELAGVVPAPNIFPGSERIGNRRRPKLLTIALRASMRFGGQIA